MAEQPGQHVRASPSPIGSSHSSHSFTPLVAMRKSKQFQASSGSSAPLHTSSLHPSIPSSGILAGSDSTLPPSMFLSKVQGAPPPPPPPRMTYIQQPIKATPQYFPNYAPQKDASTLALPTAQNEPALRSFYRLAKSPDSQRSSASCLQDIMKDVKRSVAHIPRSSSSACPSEEIHRPQPSKSPGMSSVESNRRGTSFLSSQAKIAAYTRSSRGLTPPLPCGFMTSSVGKKSSGSDSEGAFGSYKKDGEDVKILSSQSDQERKGRSDLQQGRNTKSQQSLKKPGDSIEPSNSKKPKKTRAYRAFLRKKIPRKNPVDVQSLQRVIDSMQSRTTAIYYDETDDKGGVSSNKENNESSDGGSSLQKLRDEEVPKPPHKQTTFLRQSSLQRKKSKESTPEMQSRTQSFIEANVSALIEDEEEPRQVQRPVAPSSVRYAFKQSRVVIITAKDSKFEFLKKKSELFELLSRHGGPLKSVDDTYLNEGRVIAYFSDEVSAERAFKYLVTEAPFKDYVNVMQVKDELPEHISKTASAPPLEPYIQKPLQQHPQYRHRRSDTQNSYDLRANEHDSSYHLQRLQQNMMHPSMPFQAYGQRHEPQQIQLTPSTAPTDTSRDESTRFDMNNSCRITYLNTSNEHRIPELPEQEIAMSSTYPAPLREQYPPYQVANPVLMQQSFLSQTVSDMSAQKQVHHEQRASYPEYPYMYWAPYQLDHSTPPMHAQSAMSSRGNSFNNSMATALGGNSWTSMGDEVLEQTWPGPFHYLNNSWVQGVPLNASAQPFLSTQGSSHSNFLPQLSPLQPSKEIPPKEKKSPGAVWGSLDLTTSPMLNQTQTEERPSKKQKKKEAYRCSRTLFRQKGEEVLPPAIRTQSARLNDSLGNEADIDEKEIPSQVEEQKDPKSKEEMQNVLNISRIKRGEDMRTTLMIRNIPNKYDQKLLLKTFDPDFKNLYDFFYLPIDFKNKCNVGYAFINFINPLDIPKFYSRFHQQKWPLYNSEKICDLRYARIQGCQALQDHFKSSSVMQQPDRGVRPLFGLDRQGFRNFHGSRKKKRGAPRFGKWKEREEWHSEKKGDQEFFGDPGPPPY